MAFSRFTIALFLSSACFAQDLLIADFDVSSEKERNEFYESQWRLRHRGKITGELFSIGGKPLLLSLEKKAQELPAPELYLLEYDAGIMGTKILTHAYRKALIQLKNQEVVLHLDFLYKVERNYSGKKHSAEIRSINWKDGRLHLGEIEDQEEKQYRWTGESFVLVSD